MTYKMGRNFSLEVTLLVFAVAVSTAFGWNYLAGHQRIVGCSSAGQIVCTQSCSQVSLCLGAGDNTFTTVPVESCDETKKCSAQSMACVDPSASECHDVDSDFKCHGTGYFPDPYNCSVFHICIDTAHSALTCPEDWAYDPLTTDCGLTQNDRVCKEGPVPACQQIGQAGSIPENKNIYYICVRENGVLTPELYKCGNGQVWDDGNFMCVAGF